MENKEENRTERITIVCEPQMKEVFKLMEEYLYDNNSVGNISYLLLREGLYYFLDEIGGNFSLLKADIRHLERRNSSWSYKQQFKNALQINKTEVKNEKK